MPSAVDQHMIDQGLDPNNPQDTTYWKYKYGGDPIENQVNGFWNTLSNPVGALQHMVNTGGKGNLADNFHGQGGMFFNPLGINFSDKYGARNGDMSREVFQSMSEEDWATFKKMSRDQQNAFIKERTTQIGAQGKVTEQQRLAQEQKNRELEYQQWRQKKMQDLDAFAQKMNMSVEELIASGDLGIKSARNDAAAQAGRRGVGLSGGISDLNSQRAVADAGLKYQNNRHQMGLQATQGLMQGLQGEYMNMEDRRRYEQGLNLQLQSAQAAAQNQKYMQQQQQSAGLAGAVGTVFGGIWGGAKGAEAGGQLGQAYGANYYGQQNPYQPYQYQYPSGGGGGLGGGGGGGNSQAGWGGWKPENSQ